ncbi:MAG: hypothetical protein IJO86_05390, partial [Oscillospiraceae bacterium]|nr:hypothetical protein [Oscillospiraceae bacterium]
MKKRILAIVLTVAMLVSFMPFSALTAMAADYSTGKNDGASYAMKVPATGDSIDSEWGLASAGLGRDVEGNLGTVGGTVDLAHINGENFIAYQVKSGMDGSMKINAAMKTYGKVGVPEDIDLSNTKAIAIRLKIDTMGEAYQKATFDLTIDNKSIESIAESDAAIFLDKKTGTKMRWYKGSRRDSSGNIGYDIQGNLDGWMILSLDKFSNAAGESAPITAAWLRENWETIDIKFYTTGVNDFPTLSNWDNRTFYLGDVLFVDDIDAFQAANTTKTYKPEGINSAYYAWRVPSHVGMIGYGRGYGASIHANAGKKADESGYSGANAAAHIDYFSETNFVEMDADASKANAEGSVVVNSSWVIGDYVYEGYACYGLSSSGTAKGVPAEIPTDDLKYLAVRVATSEGNTGSPSIFNMYINGSNRIGGNETLKTFIETEAEDDDGFSIKFFDKASSATYEIMDAESPVTFRYGDGFIVDGAVDGWLLIPLGAFGTNTSQPLWPASKLATDWQTVNIWLHDVGRFSSNPTYWKDRNFYLGDMLFVEDTNTFIKSIANAKIEANTIDFTSITLNTEEGALYSIDKGETWSATGVFEGLTDNTPYEIWAKFDGATKISKAVITTKDRAPYSTKLGDSAVKFMTVPHIEGIKQASDYGELGLFGKHSGGLEIVKNGNEYLYKINPYNDATYSGSTQAGLTFRSDNTVATYRATLDSSKIETAFGPSSLVDYSKVNYFAMRIKIEGGSDDADTQWSSIRPHFNGGLYRPYNILTEGLTTYFYDLTNNTVKSWTNGENFTWIAPTADDIRLKGEVDGWLLLPVESFKGWASAADTSKIRQEIAENAKTMVVNYRTLAGNSSWLGKTLYIGDMLGVENLTDFAAVRMSEGKCGESATFKFDKATGKLTINGTGAMADLTAGAPWDAYKNLITSLEISDGITTISAGAFTSLTNLASVVIPGSVTNIGNGSTAFATSVKIIGTLESAAEIYATNFGNDFVDICTEFGHQYEDTIVPPNCLDGGYTEHVCKICNDYYADNETEADPTAHKWVALGEDPATCEGEGTKYFECEICFESREDTIPMLGHDYVAVEVIAPTATEQGYTVYNCVRYDECGSTKNDDFTMPTGVAPEASFDAVSKDTAGAVNLGMGIFHFSSKFATNVGVTEAEILGELREVLEEGYVNLLYLAPDEKYLAGAVALAAEFDCDIWLSAQRYNSKTQTIGMYLEPVEAAIATITAAGAKDNLVGFYWDEPFLNGMTGAEFLTMTKTLFEKYGLRNNPVLGKDTLFDGTVTPEALAYVTDIGWDTYSFDLTEAAKSDAAQNAKLAELSEEHGVTFTTAEEYLRWYHGYVMSFFEGRDVNVWFWPGAYTVYLWTGEVADEAVVIENLKFFEKLLYEQKNPGGLVLYNYYNSTTNENEKGLANHLVVLDDEGKQVLYPRANKWIDYSNILKAMTARFNATYVVPANTVPFGTLNVTGKTTTTITYEVIEGYEYAINGGEFETDGTFDGLTVGTAYTITVKDANGNSKDFTVATKAENPYVSEYNDGSYYAYKVPTGFDELISDTGLITLHARMDNPAPIVDVDGDRMVKITRHEEKVAHFTVRPYPSTYPEYASSAKGMPAEILAHKDEIQGIAIRAKIEGGTPDQQSMTDLYINGSRTSNGQPIYFLHKDTGEHEQLVYNSGIKVPGERDGWFILPFNAWPAVRLANWQNDYNGINFWMHESYDSSRIGSTAVSDWTDKAFYIGDAYFYTDMDAFIAARFEESPIVTTDVTDKGFTATWDAVEGATKYWLNIFAEDGKTLLAIPTTTTNSITIDNLYPEKTYKLVVTTEYVEDGVTKYDFAEGVAYASVTTTKTPVIDRTPVLTAVAENGGARLTWTAIDGEHYWVYRRAVGDTAWAWYAETDEATFRTYDYVGNYEYAVVARYNAGGVIGYTGYSNAVAVEVTEAPNRTPVLAAAEVEGGVELTWTAIDGEHFWVYRRAVGTTDWAWAAETDATTITFADDAAAYEYAVISRYNAGPAVGYSAISNAAAV